MLIEKATLTVNKDADYRGEIVKALENAGFIIVKTCDRTFAVDYIIAKEDKNA